MFSYPDYPSSDDRGMFAGLTRLYQLRVAGLRSWGTTMIRYREYISECFHSDVGFVVFN